MITITRAKNERPRDRHRHRLVLKVGDRGIHITRNEAGRLLADLKRTLRPKRGGA